MDWYGKQRRSVFTEFCEWRWRLVGACGSRDSGNYESSGCGEGERRPPHQFPLAISALRRPPEVAHLLHSEGAFVVCMAPQHGYLGTEAGAPAVRDWLGERDPSHNDVVSANERPDIVSLSTFKRSLAAHHDTASMETLLHSSLSRWVKSKVLCFFDCAAYIYTSTRRPRTDLLILLPFYESIRHFPRRSTWRDSFASSTSIAEVPFSWDAFLS